MSEIMEETSSYLVKVLIIGDSAVGKTNLILRICNEKFIPSHITTIGVDFKIKNMTIDGKRVKAQIWDTAGQERFKTITEQYYKGSHGIIMAYAINDRNSFNNISNWLNQVKARVSNNKVSLLLVGNKCDLEDERQVEKAEGERLASELDIDFAETSAKENIGISDSFEKLCRLMIENYKSDLGNSSDKEKKFNLNPSKKESSGSGCCK